MPLFKKNPYHESRIQSSDVIQITKRHTSKRCIVLTDQFTNKRLSGINADILTIGKDNVTKDSLKNYDLAIYAIDCDETGSKLIDSLREWQIKFVPVKPGHVAKFFHVNRKVRSALWHEHEADTRDGITHFNEGDFCNIAQVITLTKDIGGCYAEFGTFNGASARFALRFMKDLKIQRKCFFCDTFTGFDYSEADSSIDAMWNNSHTSHGYEIVSRRLKEFETEDLEVNVLKSNIISDPLPTGLEKIAVANLDVDLLEAVESGLEKLSPRIQKGGILIVEDPGHTPMLIGARNALNRFLESNSQFIPLVMESGQTLLIKK